MSQVESINWSWISKLQHWRQYRQAMAEKLGWVLSGYVTSISVKSSILVNLFYF